MESVFITKSTFKSIIAEVDIEGIPQKLLGENIFDKMGINYLNSFQVSNLLAFKYLSENPDKITLYQKQQDSTSLKDYFLVKSSGKKYHLYPDCENIHKRFQNMIIPEVIRKKGPETCDLFREYLTIEFGKFSPNRYNELKDLIIFKINNKFNVKLNTEDLNLVDLENSGSQITRDYSLEELESNIMSFATEYLELCRQHPDIFPAFTLRAFLTKIPEKIKFIPRDYYMHNRSEEFLEILKSFFHKIQTPTYEMLKEYYMVCFNPELNFEGHLLEQLGLKPCQICQERSKSVAMTPLT
jgi:hypothetical protein